MTDIWNILQILDLYVLDLVPDHVCVTAGCIQVIVSSVLSFCCFISISADLCHIDVFCLFPAKNKSAAWKNTHFSIKRPESCTTKQVHLLLGYITIVTYVLVKAEACNVLVELQRFSFCFFNICISHRFCPLLDFIVNAFLNQDPVFAHWKFA